MTRRNFLSTTMAMGAALSAEPQPLIVPVNQVLDTATKAPEDLLHRFTASIWPEAVRDFGRCGIALQSSQALGEVRRLPGGGPHIKGLTAGALNMVLTPYIPMEWDQGRAIAGVTTRYEHYHVCMIALRYAHGHQIPFLSVNTCVHELLHALMQDIFESRAKGVSGGVKEFRIDALATRLWLFHDGSEIRKSAEVYMSRLQGFSGARSCL